MHRNRPSRPYEKSDRGRPVFVQRSPEQEELHQSLALRYNISHPEVLREGVNRALLLWSLIEEKIIPLCERHAEYDEDCKEILQICRRPVKKLQ